MSPQKLRPAGPVARGRSRSVLRRADGFTFIELLVVSTILIILASAVMPLAKVTNQRQKEAELRRSLREMRTAIDKFKDADADRSAALTRAEYATTAPKPKVKKPVCDC